MKEGYEEVTMPLRCTIHGHKYTIGDRVFCKQVNKGFPEGFDVSYQAAIITAFWPASLIDAVSLTVFMHSGVYEYMHVPHTKNGLDKQDIEFFPYLTWQAELPKEE